MIVYPTILNIFTNSGSLKLTLYNIRIMLRLTMQIILQKLTYFSFHTNPKTFVIHPSFKHRFPLNDLTTNITKCLSKMPQAFFINNLVDVS